MAASLTSLFMVYLLDFLRYGSAVRYVRPVIRQQFSSRRSRAVRNGTRGDGGQLVRLRIVAVGRPVPLAAVVFIRSFSVERSHRAPAARLPADGLVPIPMP